MTDSRSDIVDLDRRPMKDLRISVTDRCNFRCPYCMPKEHFGSDYPYLPRTDILSYEETLRIAKIFVDLGVRKVRITGGEPLLRRDLTILIRGLKALHPDLDLALTTNGALLEAQAEGLAEAGLDRLTVSCDSLDDAIFRRLNDVDFPVDRILKGIEAANKSGLTPLKINAVIKKGSNEESVLDLADHFHGTGITVRFIEYMDVGTVNRWTMDEVLTAFDIFTLINEHRHIEPSEPTYRGEVATRFRYLDGGGEIGIIASVTAPFCRDCTRIRLSANGHLFTCLFANQGHDLRTLVRSPASDDEISEWIASLWSQRTDRYSEERREQRDKKPRIQMSFIGG